MFLKVFGVIGDFSQVMRPYIVKGKCQSHITETVVMAVGLAVSGDVDELGPVSLF